MLALVLFRLLPDGLENGSGEANRRDVDACGDA